MVTVAAFEYTVMRSSSWIQNRTEPNVLNMRFHGRPLQSDRSNTAEDVALCLSCLFTLNVLFISCHNAVLMLCSGLGTKKNHTKMFDRYDHRWRCPSFLVKFFIVIILWILELWPKMCFVRSNRLWPLTFCHQIPLTSSWSHSRYFYQISRNLLNLLLRCLVHEYVGEYVHEVWMILIFDRWPSNSH